MGHPGPLGSRPLGASTTSSKNKAQLPQAPLECTTYSDLFRHATSLKTKDNNNTTFEPDTPQDLFVPTLGSLKPMDKYTHKASSHRQTNQPDFHSILEKSHCGDAGGHESHPFSLSLLSFFYFFLSLFFIRVYLSLSAIVFDTLYLMYIISSCPEAPHLRQTIKATCNGLMNCMAART